MYKKVFFPPKNDINQNTSSFARKTVGMQYSTASHQKLFQLLILIIVRLSNRGNPKLKTYYSGF